MVSAFIKNIFKLFYLSSLNVVLASVVCCVAFFKLPLGNYTIDLKTIAQLASACWAIYIFDRLSDNIETEEPKTERHIFHKKHQYNFQILLIALVLTGLALAFIQPLSVTLFGIGILALTGTYFYLLRKTKSFRFYKELVMPFIYVFAIVGLPFYLSSSINLSSWLLAFMFFGVIIQNVLAFSFFESTENEPLENICKKIGQKSTRRIINYWGSLNLFLFVFLFANEWTYSSKLSFVLLLISLATSIIVANASRFKSNYRWMIDSLLFLPILIF